MESTDITLKVLQGIHDEIKGLRADQQETRVEARQFREEVNVRFEEVNARFEEVNALFEVIETAIRDMAQQLVMLARCIKVAIESRALADARLDDIERRLLSIEERQTG